MTREQLIGVLVNMVGEAVGEEDPAIYLAPVIRTADKILKEVAR